jgi:hypothetical protein
MKFSGIDMQGYFKAHTVVDASALFHQASDESRMVYDETTKDIWIADSSEWKSMGGYSNIPQNTIMWVYADSPPDGWSLYASPGDVLVAIKGGGTYTTGGSIQGNFNTPSHSHGLNSHTHVTSGTVNNSAGNSEGDNSGVTAGVHNHNASIASTTAAGSTGIGGSASGYRPRARVGILCTR